MTHHLVTVDSGEINIIHSGMCLFKTSGQIAAGCVDHCDDHEKVAAVEFSVSNDHCCLNVKSEVLPVCLNDEIIEPGSMVRLEHQDRLKFGSSEYLFRSASMALIGIDHNEERGMKAELGERLRVSATYYSASEPDYQIKILENCKPDIFLDMDYMVVEDKIRIRYDRDGLQPLNSMLEGDLFNLYRVVYNIADAIIRAEDYLIRHDCMALTSERIFADPLTLEIRLMFVPDGSGSKDIFHDLGNIIKAASRKKGCGYFFSCADLLLLHLRNQYSGLESFTRILLDEERSYLAREAIILRGAGLAAEDEIPDDDMNDETMKFGGVGGKLHEYWNKSGKAMIVTQAAASLIMIGVLLSDKIGPTDKFCFALLLAAADLWMLKGFRWI